MIRRPPRSTQSRSSAASDVYKRQLLGPAREEMSDDDLAAGVEDTVVFARLSPHHKERIIHALQSRGHVVGFLGDGINDAPALRTADVGISVDSAVDICLLYT